MKNVALNGNIPHSKHRRFIRKRDLVLNEERSPFKTRSLFLVKRLCFVRVKLLLKTRTFKTTSRAGRDGNANVEARTDSVDGVGFVVQAVPFF